MIEDINITYIQSDILWENIQLNLSNIERLINNIQDDTNVIVLPEMFSTGFTMNFKDIAEEEDKSKAIKWMYSVAKAKDVVICGSLIIKDGGNFFNRLIWMQPDGIYQRYDKRHLFRLAGEHKFYSQGEKKLLIEYKGWKFSPLVCYDLRFPVWSKNTISALNEYNYDCLIYVANWPQTRMYPWKSLLIARAIENQSYVIGVNRIGVDGDGISFSGHSIVVDPKGVILSKENIHKEQIETIKLSYKNLYDYRKHFAVANDWDKFKIENIEY